MKGSEYVDLLKDIYVTYPYFANDCCIIAFLKEASIAFLIYL